MKIAYLINQYPKISHSFIRREITELERQGVNVVRFGVRTCKEELVDEADILELKKTKVILKESVINLLWQLLGCAITHPINFFKAIYLTLRIGWLSERGILIHLVYLLEACLLCKWLKIEGISHVHAHFGTNSTTVAMLCSILDNFTYSFTVHGPEEFDKPQLIALSEKIQRASFIIGVSDFGRSQLYRWCEYHQWFKIQVVHCGVDELYLGTPHSDIPDIPRLVCVGRLCEQKGQLLLLQAVALLKQLHIKFKLILVGDGPMRGEIETLIHQLDLVNYIEITGWANSSRVKQEILAAKCLVLPSFAEGLPVVIMEALALRRPVISTYIAGIPELVTPECGWLVPAGNVEGLAEAIQEALSSPIPQLQQMGIEGYERVVKEHDITKEVSKLAAMFHNVSAVR